MINISVNRKKHPVYILSRRYPQLLLPIEKDIHQTEIYRDAVLRGNIPDNEPQFSFHEKDTLTSFKTSAGAVDILFLENRPDFEHAVRALAYRCEPESIPPSMGATSISGLINWQKIHNHLQQYQENGGEDPDEEFRRFTADKSNYLDALIVLSSGEYSAVPASEMNLDSGEWKEKSITIRQFHELTHFYCRKQYPENKEALRDEVIADMIGLVSAFGFYDTHAAELFLGIEGDSYRKGGRLENYLEGKDPERFIRQIHETITLLSETVEAYSEGDIFELIDYIEKNKIGSFNNRRNEL